MSHLSGLTYPTDSSAVTDTSTAGGPTVKDSLDTLVTDAAAADATALHKAVSNEIHVLTDKALPVLADEVVGENSANSWSKIRIAIGNLFKAVGWIDGLTAKPVPLAADTLAVGDSAASGAPKKSTVQEIFATTGLIDGLTLKAAPVGGDHLKINDSEDNEEAKKVTIDTLPITQAQVGSILLQPAADADPVAILNTTGAIELQVTGAANVAITTTSSVKRQEVKLFAKAVAGGGSYTLELEGGTDLTLNATGEGGIVKRNEANTAWVCIQLSGGATIV
jgi:hypothetical protein